MRIIAGTCGGRRIASPSGSDTRPTADRVREALFSILTSRINHARVLDLFAGSGALGLEAISRGAAQAVFVDTARMAQNIISDNIKMLGMQQQATLLRMEYRAAISHLSGQVFDIIFIDPPYRMGQAEPLAAIWAAKLLTDDGVIVYERAKGDAWDATPFCILDERRYGDTVLSFLCMGGENT